MLGIVIANWNGEKLIEKCLESLKLQTFKNFKVYIVDNGSNDNSLNIIRKYEDKLNISIISLAYNSGFARANNIGIKMAINDNCDYIMTLNNDIELENKCIQNCISHIDQDNDKMIYQLLMINYFDRNIVDCIGINVDKRMKAKQIDYKQKVDNVMKNEYKDIYGPSAGAAIYSQKALLDVISESGEFFDERFFAYFEDVDLAIRLRKKNYKTKLLKNCIVYHMHSETGKKSTGFKEYYITRNRYIYTYINSSRSAYKILKYECHFQSIKSLIRNINNINVMKSIIKGINDAKYEVNKLRRD